LATLGGLFGAREGKKQRTFLFAAVDEQREGGRGGETCFSGEPLGGRGLGQENLCFPRGATTWGNCNNWGVFFWWGGRKVQPEFLHAEESMSITFKKCPKGIRSGGAGQRRRSYPWGGGGFPKEVGGWVMIIEGASNHDKFMKRGPRQNRKNAGGGQWGSIMFKQKR